MAKKRTKQLTGGIVRKCQAGLIVENIFALEDGDVPSWFILIQYRNSNNLTRYNLISMESGLPYFEKGKTMTEIFAELQKNEYLRPIGYGENIVDQLNKRSPENPPDWDHEWAEWETGYFYRNISYRKDTRWFMLADMTEEMSLLCVVDLTTGKVVAKGRSHYYISRVSGCYSMRKITEANILENIDECH